MKMKKILTGGIAFTASEIVQLSNVNDLAGAITQIMIAIITIIGLFNKKKSN